jgi:DNA-binding transcriptional LysR family regulator
VNASIPRNPPQLSPSFFIPLPSASPRTVQQSRGEAQMIELRHLRYFIAVAEELNFRRAAEHVHIDQTPLSRTILALEDQLGVQLFVRAPRKRHLTPAGLRLNKEARKVVIRAVREIDARFRTPLRIGVADGIAQPKLTECIVRWRGVAPEAPLELTELRACELVDALQCEELDADFCFGLPHDFAIAQQPAWSYSTLCTAHALGYQARLGPAWFDVSGMLVYESWKLFEWWCFFDAYAPQMFERGGIIAASSGMLATVAAIRKLLTVLNAIAKSGQHWDESLHSA